VVNFGYSLALIEISLIALRQMAATINCSPFLIHLKNTGHGEMRDIISFVIL
jgi:hypothetical protein